MSDIIQLLPDHVANQIAAGEVVQRPASVVKELLENSIDARSSHIQLIVKDAGKTLIQVIDDGLGMSETDARMSFERHATSKIKSADDLFQVQSKGFRGEALASIAAIAHIELKTRTPDEELGTCINIEGSSVKSQEVIVSPKGTSLSVKNLFFNIPARRNFLKSNKVELRHVIDEFHRVALAHPEVSFSFHHNENELFSLPKSNQRQRVVHIFGAKTNEKLVPVKENTEVLKIDGYVGKPEFSRKTRSEQFFFVNRRFIKSPYLNHAVVSAFEGLLKDGYHPSYFLNLTVDPKTIDINIHPTKTEIKFEDEHTLYALLRSAVKHSLGQFNIAPILDFEKDSSLETPYHFKNRKALNPKIEVDRDFNPFVKSNTGSSNFVKGSFSQLDTGKTAWDALYHHLEVDLDNEKGTDKNFIQSFESKLENPGLFKDAHAQIEGISHQVDTKYIVKPMTSRILIVDQNRAHQRVLYEKFLKQLTIKTSVSQQLLFPLELHFSKPEMDIVNELQEDLESAGFLFQELQNEGLIISGVPSIISEQEVRSVFEQLISDVEHQVPEQNFSVLDLMAKSMASSIAIKKGQTLDPVEQIHLVDALFACKEPDFSPAGLKTFIIIESNDLEKKFK
jgi:DNA mismatch repair protein MutL